MKSIPPNLALGVALWLPCTSYELHNLLAFHASDWPTNLWGLQSWFHLFGFRIDSDCQSFKIVFCPQAARGIRNHNLCYRIAENEVLKTLTTEPLRLCCLRPYLKCPLSLLFPIWQLHISNSSFSVSQSKNSIKNYFVFRKWIYNIMQ